MIKRFTFIIGLVGLIGFQGLDAQDIHFSQFYMSPLNLNPAMTGVMNCKMRFTANFRNQWAAVLKENAFNTFNASYDQKVESGRYDYFGFGATFWGDQAGAVDFQTLSFKLSGSYSKRMGGSRTSSHYLVLGADGSFNQRSIDFQNAIFGDQIKDGVADPTIPSVETLPDNSFIFGDLSIGMLWFSVLDKENNFYLGAAFNHLNQANQSFYDNRIEELYTKLTLHAGGEFRMTRRVGLVPGIVSFIQGPNFELNGGTSVRFHLGRSKSFNQSFQAGAWVRLANRYDNGILMDAFILSTRFDYNNFGLGFSYDINTSELSSGTYNNGAFEFSLVYNICRPERRGVYCPNF